MTRKVFHCPLCTEQISWTTLADAMAYIMKLVYQDDDSVRGTKHPCPACRNAPRTEPLERRTRTNGKPHNPTP